MEEIIKLFTEIQNTSSTNGKREIIAANADNELFKKCLAFLCDKNIVTGISSKKLKKAVKVSTDTSATWEDCMEYLKEHNTGTDEDIAYVISFLDKNQDHYDFYADMITKKLKLGIDVKGVNKAIPHLIWTYNTQQAYPISDKNKPKNGEWFSLSQKINGINAGFIDGKCLSRQGKEMCGFNHITEALKQLGLEDFYVNGELVRRNEEGLSDNENFRLSTSIINSDAEGKPEIDFIFYEVITKDEFEKGESNLTYKDRLVQYRLIANEIEEKNIPYIHFINHFYEGTDLDEINYWLAYADEHGYEGCMLNKDTFWQNKRNNGILKIKTFHSADVPCVAVEEGEGRLAGTLGKIKCDYKGNDLYVGSGFTDEQRADFWAHPEKIVGHIVAVKYKDESKNQNGGISLQFPVFTEVREDGKEISYED